MKVPTYLPLPTFFRNDRSVKRAMKDFPNGTGYAGIVILLEILTSQPNMKYYFDDIDILSDEVGISIPIIKTIIKRYGIFSIETTEDGKKFFSPKLNILMEPYFNIVEENKLKGIKSGIARRKKLEQDIEDLKFSLDDSSEPLLSNGLTNKQTRIEQKKENNNEEIMIEKWLNYKSKSAKNKGAYKFKMKNSYYEGISSVVEDFENFKSDKLKEEKIELEQEKFKKFIGRQITFKNIEGINLTSDIKIIEPIARGLKIYTEVGSFIIANISILVQALKIEEGKH